MNNIDFFIEGCRNNAYRYKEWVYSVFCITDRPTVKDEDHYPYRIYQKDGMPCYYLSDINPQADPNELVYILLNGKPIKDDNILLVDEEIKITEKDIVSFNKTGEITTTPGIFFVNYYVYISGLGSKMKKYGYQEGPNINLKRTLTSIALDCQDDVPDDEMKDDTIYVKEVKACMNAAISLSGFCNINAPSATPYTMTPSDDVQSLKKELLNKYKDRLDDPVVVADIEKQLVAKDKEYVESDPDGGFYIENKSVNLVRKKLHTMQGMQKRMDASKPDVLIDTPLSESASLDKMPAIIDGIRDGSYNRGAMTALGGEAVKFIYRIFQAAEIIKEDCGTTLGIRRVIPADNLNRYIGSYIIEGNQSILLTKDNISKYSDKEVVMRSPAFCLAEPTGRGYCSKCMSEAYRGYNKSLAAYAASVASTMNNRFMKAMHVDALKTKKLLLDKSLT